MAYSRKTAKVEEPELTGQMVGDLFINGAKDTEKFIRDMNEDGELQSVQEITASVHAVGAVLHEQLMEMAQKPEHRDLIVEGTIEIFKGMAEQRLDYVPAEYDKKTDTVIKAHAQYRDVKGDVKDASVTLVEASNIIRRTGICYGLVSGMARAASEALREEDEKQ